mgnify:CR=1 FL=1
MIVVKFGGHAMSDSHGDFAQAIADAISLGVEIVSVQGGGPQIGTALESAGITTEFIGGFRVTTPEVFEIVERVLAMEIGPAVAQSLCSHGIKAVAISGRDSKTLIAEKLTTLVDGTRADLGLVGTVIEVNPEKIQTLVTQGSVPVISPVATDALGTHGFNVNADIAAAAIAGAVLRATGSNKISAGVTPMSRHCSPTKKRWSLLATTMGRMASAVMPCKRCSVS